MKRYMNSALLYAALPWQAAYFTGSSPNSAGFLARPPWQWYTPTIF